MTDSARTGGDPSPEHAPETGSDTSSDRGRLHDPSRRLVLIGLTALGIVACTRGGPRHEPQDRHGPGHRRHHGGGSDDGAGAEADETALAPDDGTDPAGEPGEADAAELPSRDEIVDRHGHRTPTRWGLEDLPGLVERTTSTGVVLTLDLCGGPNGSALDEPIVDLLVREAVPTVFFVNRRWIDANPDGFDRLLAHDDLFEIANHGTSHLPLSVEGRSAYGIPGTADVGAVYDEIAGNHERLRELTGRAPRWFRSGTAHYDDIALDVIGDLGERAVGFDVNADAGATFGSAQVAAAMADATAGSIVIGHANQPSGGTADGLAAAIPAVRARGLDFVPLDPAIVTNGPTP